MIVTTELVENIDTKKFTPVIRGNTSARKVPQFLGPRAYADFSRDEDYTNKLNELVAEIHNSPPTKPPVGASPFSGSIAPVEGSRRIVGPTGITNSGAVLEDAWFFRNAQTASCSLTKLGFKASMELRYALHDPINKPQVVLLNAVRKSEIRTFGWPLALPGKQTEHRPKAVRNGICAEVPISDLAFTGRPSYDYWALRNNGDSFFSRSYEDMRDESAIFFITRIVRVTEALLFAANLYRALDVPDETKASVRVTHRGFSGRKLSRFYAISPASAMPA